MCMFLSEQRFRRLPSRKSLHEAGPEALVRGGGFAMLVSSNDDEAVRHLMLCLAHFAGLLTAPHCCGCSGLRLRERPKAPPMGPPLTQPVAPWSLNRITPFSIAAPPSRQHFLQRGRFSSLWFRVWTWNGSVGVVLV